MNYALLLLASEHDDYQQCDNEAVNCGSLRERTADDERSSYIALCLGLTGDGLRSLSGRDTYSYTCANACKYSNSGA